MWLHGSQTSKAGSAWLETITHLLSHFYGWGSLWPPRVRRIGQNAPCLSRYTWTFSSPGRQGSRAVYWEFISTGQCFIEVTMLKATTFASFMPFCVALVRLRVSAFTSSFQAVNQNFTHCLSISGQQFGFNTSVKGREFMMPHFSPQLQALPVSHLPNNPAHWQPLGTCLAYKESWCIDPHVAPAALRIFSINIRISKLPIGYIQCGLLNDEVFSWNIVKCFPCCCFVFFQTNILL